MARDYRYGHKATSIKPRRTQLQADLPMGQDDLVAARQPVIKPEPSLTTEKTATRAQSVKRIFSDRRKKQTEPESVEVNSQTKEGRRASKQETVDENLQKIKDKIHYQSLPKHVRRQMEAEEVKAKEAEAQAELARLEQKMQWAHQRQRRNNLWIWFTIVLLTIIGFVWVFYATFFLSFAAEMGWVSKETRERLDPAARVRSHTALVAAPEPQARLPKTQIEEAADPEQIQYTFYKDLSKDEVTTGFNHPLAISQTTPTYVQLLSTTKESYAQKERQRLAQKGYTVQLANITGQAGSFYVLRMGPYTDPLMLNRLRIELEALGVEASLVKAQTP